MLLEDPEGSSLGNMGHGRPDTPYPFSHLLNSGSLSDSLSNIKDLRRYWSDDHVEPIAPSLPIGYRHVGGSREDESSDAPSSTCLVPPTLEAASGDSTFNIDGSVELLPLLDLHHPGDEGPEEGEVESDDDVPPLEDPETSDTDSSMTTDTDSSDDDSESEGETDTDINSSGSSSDDDEDDDQDDDDQDGGGFGGEVEGGGIPTTAYEILASRSTSNAIKEARKRLREGRLLELRQRETLSGPVVSADKFVDAVTPQTYGHLLSYHPLLDPGTPAYVNRDRYRSILLRINRRAARRHAAY